MRPTAEQVLRRHAIERMRQRSIPSRDMEQTLTLVRDECEPRMSSEAWVDSCLLTKGVDERLWPILSQYYCGWDERANEKQAAAARGESKFWPCEVGEHGLSVGRDETAVVSQSAVQMTFQQACFVAGMGYAEGRKLRYAALLRVAENIAGVKP